MCLIPSHFKTWDGNRGSLAFKKMNGFLFPLVLTQSASIRVFPFVLWDHQGQFTMNAPAILVAVLLFATPIILLYTFGRRQLLSGLIAGSSK